MMAVTDGAKGQKPNGGDADEHSAHGG